MSCCDYCYHEVPIASDGEQSVSVSRFNALSIVFKGWQMHRWMVPINFCPMCGRDLKKK